MTIVLSLAAKFVEFHIVQHGDKCEEGVLLVFLSIKNATVKIIWIQSGYSFKVFLSSEVTKTIGYLEMFFFVFD